MSRSRSPPELRSRAVNPIPPSWNTTRVTLDPSMSALPIDISDDFPRHLLWTADLQLVSPHADPSNTMWSWHAGLLQHARLLHRRQRTVNHFSMQFAHQCSDSCPEAMTLQQARNLRQSYLRYIRIAHMKRVAILMPQFNVVGLFGLGLGVHSSFPAPYLVTVWVKMPS